MEVSDVFGIQPLAEATKIAIDKSFTGLSVFLEKVFLPGLQEFGFYIKDQVREWRLMNALKVMDKAKDRLTFKNDELQILANPRVGLSILQECSMVDDTELQDMWAGIFASSCTIDGKDDSNIIFVDLLKRMSVVEARILKYACENCIKTIYPNRLIIAETIEITFEELKIITGVEDIYRLDRELDHMLSLSLLADGTFGPFGGFTTTDINLKAGITPTALALNLYYKSNAINISQIDFWGDKLQMYKEDNEAMSNKIKE